MILLRRPWLFSGICRNLRTAGSYRFVVSGESDQATRRIIVRDMMLSGGGAWFFLMMGAIIAILFWLLFTLVGPARANLHGHQVIIYTSRTRSMPEPI